MCRPWTAELSGGLSAGHRALLGFRQPGLPCLGGEEMAAVPLSDAIADLRTELQQAIAAGQGEELRFELGPVVLELEVTLTTSAGGDVRVGLWSVLTAGASADHSRGSVHRLTLTLTPRLDSAPQKEVLVADAPGGLPPAHPVEGD